MLKCQWTKKDIDFSKTKFDAMAGDPYYGGNEPKD
jgi:tRNA G10  N-methylase Trm11